MGEEKKGLTRRDFLRGTVSTALAGAAGVSLCCQKDNPAEAETRTGQPAAKRAPVKDRAKVVLVRDEKVLDDAGRVDPEVITRMLDDGVAALLGEEKPAAAWARLFGPGDTVGVKSNVWRFLATPRELEEAIRQRLVGVGVASDKIDFDDRGVLANDIFTKATALINVRPLRTHHWSGVGSLIKNYIMFTPTPWALHDDACADLAKVWNLPLIKGKTRLNVLVMLTPLFHGKGPHHFNAQYTWPYKGLIVGTDPVAVDATGLRILEARRKAFFGKDEPFATSAKHIALAETRHKLGVADPEKIELVRLGWKDGILI